MWFSHFYWGPSGRGPLPVNGGAHSFFSHSKLGPWGSCGWLGTSGMFPSSRRGTVGQEGGPLRRADRWGPIEKGWPVSLLSKRETGPRGERRESMDQKIRDAGKWGDRDLETWETRTMDTERRPRERPNRHKEAEQRPGEVETQEDKTPESNRDCEPGQGQKSGTMTETQSAKTDKANFTACGLYLLKEKKSPDCTAESWIPAEERPAHHHSTPSSARSKAAALAPTHLGSCRVWPH